MESWINMKINTSSKTLRNKEITLTPVKKSRLPYVHVKDVYDRKDRKIYAAVTSKKLALFVLLTRKRK